MFVVVVVEDVENSVKVNLLFWFLVEIVVLLRFSKFVRWGWNLVLVLGLVKYKDDVDELK